MIEIDFHASITVDHEQEHEHDYEALFPEHLEHFDATIAVAPLVVVPTDHFHETVAEHDREFAVEDARMRIADDVVGHERFVTVFEHAFVALVRRGFFPTPR